MTEDTGSFKLATTRRRLLGTAVGGAAVSALAMPHIARAAAPIRIGLLQAKEGSIALQAQYLQQGTFLALEQMGNQLLGQPAEIVWDDEPSAQGAGQNALQLIQQQQVVGLLGGSLSDDALAEEAVAGQYRVPFIVNNGAAEAITGAKCNPYTFRLQPPVPVQAAAMLPYLQSIGKRWYFLSASYAFGQDIVASFKQLLSSIGGTVVGDDEVPVGTSDYSAYILKIREAQPDLVIGGLTSGDLSNFFKQWTQFGMKDKIPFAEIAVGDTDLWSVGKEDVAGIYTSLWYYRDPHNTAKDKAFAAAYQAKYNRPAADKAWMGWFCARVMFEAINAAGSTKPEAIVEALQNWHEEDNGVTVHFDKWNNQLVRRFLIVGVKKDIPNKWDYFNVLQSVPSSDAQAAQVFGSAAESACHMTPL
ncbi:ABC transporter substrate-binding protein [Acidocella sp.]|uniref:ABC transporter substrate-binding protein n=1 Tax=Acidocella sp. TaxID=50710 RepID=UPI002627F416|nr:ABC transporter substrate-binding protein [Acidocella sp.]